MENIRKLFFLLLALAVVSGCSPSGATGETRSSVAPQARTAGPTYIGTWLRQATYTNGQLMHQEPATLTYNKDSFDSLNKYCSVSGDLSISGNNARMVTKKTDCPGHSVGTQTVYTFTISADGRKMTIINTQYGAEVKEIYARK